MSSIPHDKSPDSTLALALDGYEFILKRSRRYGSDVFRARLMLQPFLCMTGEEAARVFYDTERFIRKGAAPRRVKATLFGFGGVQHRASLRYPNVNGATSCQKPRRTSVQYTHSVWRWCIRSIS